MKPCWLLLIFIFLICPEMLSKISCSILSRDWGGVDWPVVPWFLLLYLFEDRDGIFFPPVFRNFFWSPYLIIDCCLAINSGSPLTVHECVLSMPMDLCIYSLLKYSLNQSFSTKGTTFFHQPFSLVCGNWNSWRSVLLVMTKARKAFSTSALSYTLHNQVPHLIE